MHTNSLPSRPPNHARKKTATNVKSLFAEQKL